MFDIWFGSDKLLLQMLKLLEALALLPPSTYLTDAYKFTALGNVVLQPRVTIVAPDHSWLKGVTSSGSSGAKDSE